MENNERKNNNRGMFYAVMGVATLVITLIGATFAYFVAETNSTVNAISANSGQVSLGYSDVKTGLHTDLIPVDVALENGGVQVFNKGGHTLLPDAFDLDKDNNKTESISYKFAGINVEDCHDTNGNAICSVYQFTVTNTSTTIAQKVYATFTVNTDEFSDDLKYALFKGTAADVTNSTNGWDVDGTAVTDVTLTSTAAGSDGSFSMTTNNTDAVRKNVIGKPGDLIISAKKTESEAWNDVGSEWNRLTQTLDIGEKMTYTMIIWLQETYTNQNDDMTSDFKATVSFTTAGDGTGVTGSLIA